MFNHGHEVFDTARPADDFQLANIRLEKREGDLRQRGSCYRAFEIVLYNQQVRECLKSNVDHPLFSERWADLQHTIVHARDEIGLARRLNRQFPRSEGFVIVDIIEQVKAEVI